MVPLAAPSPASASAGDGQVTLLWPPVSGASGYRVSRTSPAGGPFTVTSPALRGHGPDGRDGVHVHGDGDGWGGSGPALSPATATPSAASGTASLSVNAGGGAAAPFSADAGFSGGALGSVSSRSTRRGSQNPAPQAVYQSYRYGTFGYALTGLTPGASYTVRLHFAEPTWSAAGKRGFNVSVNGVQLLTNYDVYAAAGAQNRAVVVPASATADGTGSIPVSFVTVTNTALVCGLEVDAAGAGPVAAGARRRCRRRASGRAGWRCPGGASGAKRGYNVYRGT